MKLVTEAAIAEKIRKMKQRVKWQEPVIVERGIDQTRLAIDDGASDNPEFSFLVVGDSGAGPHWGYNPQRQIAELMLPHHQESSFMLHTGDVIYLVGSSEFYPDNFIKPYREFIVGGENPERISYDRMVFQLPILPVPGNHDYYDLPLLFGLISLTTLPLRRLLGSGVDLDVGWRGSGEGDVYARAFLDYLKGHMLPGELSRHLDEYYTVQTTTGRCLRYQPGRFTRLPNRYYTFRYGGIDFFALDSNTFNNPRPLPKTQEGDAFRKELELRRQSLEQEKMRLMDSSPKVLPTDPHRTEKLDDVRTNVSQIEEIIVDIDKQLSTHQETATDIEQLEWLKQRLIESWNCSDVRGRVIYFHHPPYVTEATKWQQAQTLAVRHRLRNVLSAVAKVVGSKSGDRPLVDLVLNGHAHCLEHLETVNRDSADFGIHWIVCGGSGYSLRRQRPEGSDLYETFVSKEKQRLVARSYLFIGRNGQGLQKRRPYTSLRIDVKDGCPPKFIVRTFVAEWYQRQWNNYEIEPFVI
ncbi:metallophosphoesterase [Scytonema sp. UIC 10036]|uniref:metallophosphoesterase family protein n=1 Tax=Scytonema sp. UIC 10036 TaxID=2304196 RepID=UPI0012DACDFB|nr:metallophosphoesterase [Scytonema sp. UIC 10036]MUG92105.1 metallophosphoesterase [Scytonema sp. UIC 10036]